MKDIKEFVVKKKIEEVFDIIYNDNLSVYESLYDIKSWHTGEWKEQNGKMKRVQQCNINIPDLPNAISEYTLEKKKLLNIKIKNKMLLNNTDNIKVNTRLQLVNINPVLKKLINTLDIIKVKNIIDLKKIDETNTQVRIENIIKINIPKSSLLETFIISSSNRIFDCIITNINES